ncbi:hypothetical protein Bphyt_5461 [Paraburkholderia phytofirmans PsJN]|uniref:Uncharacterized protein n=1 Tax=Paraburkholderia phytofirmans (strain DSM 17436 / LMG 22146 / PsJN) TaxID=398527 RepID=B2TE18_PARPJ|nr:hypothetical protein Bphyt_5461 [Paraburkholderia phytofirmans PsJN]
MHQVLLDDVAAKARKTGYAIDDPMVTPAHADKAMAKIHFKDRTISVCNAGPAAPESVTCGTSENY